MKDNLDVEKLFKSKFESFEPAVNVKVWQNVAANVAGKSVASSAATGSALWVKSIIVGAVATVVGIGTWAYLNDEPADKVVENIRILPQEKEVITVAADSNPVEPFIKNNELTSESEVNQNAIVASDEVAKQSDDNHQKTVINGNASHSTEQGDQLTREGKQAQENQLLAPNDDVSERTTVVANQKESNELVELNVKSNVLDSAAAAQPNSIEQSEKTTANVLEPEVNESYINNIPNIFTPNSDNINDEFFIEDLANIAEFYIVIYTKANMKVYESVNANFRWDGYNMYGNKVRADVYYYLIKAVGVDGKVHSIPGQITVR